MGISFRSFDQGVTPDVSSEEAFENSQRNAYFRFKAGGALHPSWDELDACELLSEEGKLIGDENQVTACMNQ